MNTQNYTLEQHDRNTPKRDQIIIGLGHKDCWISIVEEQYIGDYAGSKELALVHSCEGEFFDIELVPLNKWFDSEQPDGECTIKLGVRRGEYLWLKGACEGQVVTAAITRAMSYIEQYK